MGRILVTGRAGFIVRHGACTPRSCYDVVVCDAFHHYTAFESPHSCRERRISHGDPASGRGSCAYPTFLTRVRCFDNFTVSSPSTSFTWHPRRAQKQPTLKLKVGLKRSSGQLRIFWRAVESCDRFQESSTSLPAWCTETSSKTPTREDAPKEPIELFGGFKLLAESLVKTYGRRYGLPFSIVRPAAVYGPANNNRSVMQVLVERCARPEASSPSPTLIGPISTSPLFATWQTALL